MNTCIVCGKEASVTIIDNDHLCTKHNEFYELGYVVIIEVIIDKCTFEDDGTLLPQNAPRTGKAAIIKREAASKVLKLSKEKMSKFIFFVQEGSIEIMKLHTVCSN